MPDADAPEPRAREWSRPARAVLASAACAVALAAVAHIGLTFLAVAPKNQASRDLAPVVNAYIYPELEQNWQLFAPNPLARDESVEASASITTPGGDFRTTPWRDLSAADDAVVRHNPVPSHANQNVLRRAWDLYADSHDEQHGERAYDARGRIIGDYLRRIALQRLEQSEVHRGERIVRVRIRCRMALVPPPPWDTARAANRHAKPWFRTLPWWNVEPADRSALGIRA